jgi:uncharacterized protein (TIGR02246 family)
MTDVDISIARDAIRDLVARYNQLGDTGRVDALAQLFSNDAVLETPSDVCRGRDGILALFASVASRTKSDAKIKRLRHFTATHAIDIDSANEATGICYYQVLTENGLDHWGVYADRYVRGEDGLWLFAARTAGIDGMTPGGWAEQMATDSDKD